MRAAINAAGSFAVLNKYGEVQAAVNTVDQVRTLHPSMSVDEAQAAVDATNDKLAQAHGFADFEAVRAAHTPADSSTPAPGTARLAAPKKKR